MPLVIVFMDPAIYKKKNAKKRLALLLPHSVASDLSAKPNAELLGSEITVLFRKFQPGDVHTHQVEVYIWANDYPERRAILDKASDSLCNMVERELRRVNVNTTSLFVWILLQTGNFAEWTSLRGSSS